MCHGCFSLLLVATGDAGDLDFGVVLPVAHLLAMVLAAAELDDADLVGATVADDFRGHAGALERVADLDAVAVAEHEHVRSEEHTSELQSLMRISYAVFCLKKNNIKSDMSQWNLDPHTTHNN